MAGPGIASYLATRRADGSSPGWFPSTDLPRFSGTVSDPTVAPEDLVVYARLWTMDDQLVWHRRMPYQGMSGGSPVYAYQTVFPSDRADYVRFLTFGDNITGGYWRFVWYGAESADIPWGASEAQVRTIIENHPDIGKNNVYISWAPSIRRLTVGLRGRLANTNVNNNGINAMGVRNALTGTNRTITLSTFTEGKGDFPTTSGQYKWDMVAMHPSTFVFSGGKGGVRSALGPAPQVFYLDQAPTISSTSPANSGSLLTSGGTFSWDQSNLGAIPVTWIRGLIQDDANPGTFIHAFSQKGTNLNAIESFDVPPQTFKNGGSYTWFGEVYKESGAVQKWQNTFTIAFTRPATHAANFAVEPDGSSIVVQWAQSALSDSVFNSYVIKVRPVGAAEDGPENIEVWRTSFKNRTIQRIFKFPRNRAFIMSFYVRRNVSGDVVDSMPSATTRTVNIRSVIIANPATSEYVLLDWQGEDGRTVPYLQDPISIPVWGAKLPVASLPVQRSRAIDFEAKLLGTLEERRALWHTIESLYLNEAESPLFYGDAFDGWFDIVLNRPVPTILPGWNVTDVSISGFEIDALEEAA